MRSLLLEVSTQPLACDRGPGFVPDGLSSELVSAVAVVVVATRSNDALRNTLAMAKVGSRDERTG